MCSGALGQFVNPSVHSTLPQVTTSSESLTSSETLVHFMNNEHLNSTNSLFQNESWKLTRSKDDI